MNKRHGLYIICRYFAAFMLLIYGFAKINGSQFTVVDWVLDEPLKEVSGFWLTWYYFGYSTTYKWIVALVEIGGGLLLLFRRTTLLGSMLLFGMMLNIVLVDIFFRVDAGALLMALVITFCLGVILAYHRNELIELFWSKQNSILPSKADQPKARITKGIIRTVIIVFPILFTYWIANFNNRNPTPIDGTWNVIETESDIDRKNLPTRIYFEYNRAYQARFRYNDSLSADYFHFEVDPLIEALDIWKGWLSKDKKYFSGTYDLKDDTLFVQGVLNRQNKPVNLKMIKVR